MRPDDALPNPLNEMRSQHIVDLSSQRPVGLEVFAGSPTHRGEMWHHAPKEDVDRAFLATLEHLSSTLPVMAPSLRFASVNVDPVSIDQAHTAAVASCVEAFGDRSLILEVLETSTLSAVQLAVLRDWAAAGALLVVDDYGVAHADAVRLAQHDWYGVKLARAMVLKLASDPVSVAEVSELLARYSYVVAEGIETEDQSMAARAAGVTLAQGWLYHRPHRATAERPYPAPSDGLLAS